MSLNLRLPATAAMDIVTNHVPTLEEANDCAPRFTTRRRVEGNARHDGAS
jgi:hypothetical protein